MYRPVSSHSDRGDAVKRSDLITIEAGKGFVVLVEEGGNLDFKRFRHRFPPSAIPHYCRAQPRATLPLRQHMRHFGSWHNLPCGPSAASSALGGSSTVARPAVAACYSATANGVSASSVGLPIAAFASSTPL